MMKQEGGDGPTQADTRHGRLAKRKAAGMDGVDATVSGPGEAVGSGEVDVSGWLREAGKEKIRKKIGVTVG